MASALVVQDLVKSFGAIRAVDGVSLSLAPRGIHSLIGPNGAGKTTVFNCISGFLTPGAGRVFLGGQDVTGWPPHRLVAAGLARTFQITTIFGEVPVIENVELATRSRLGHNLDLWRGARSLIEARTRAEEILSLVGLADKADIRADELSHGDKRVLEVALALALRPAVLLLDEPTAGMSAAETGRIADLICRIADRASVLLIEHDTEMVLAISDEITVMTQGRVIAHGPPKAISQDSRVRDAYLGAIDVGTD